MVNISSEQAWEAFASRDPQWDGTFYTGVRTTRIYCRPSCPARLPKRENVVFFATPDDAERDGYRACLRCAPRGLTSDREAAHKAVAYLDAHADRRVPLDELGKAAGMSPTHLQRVFKRHVGVSPRVYAQTKKAERLKAQLRSGETVTRASYEAGFGSEKAAYANAGTAFGMTPGQYRRGGDGKMIAFAVTQTPLANALIAVTDRGVAALYFGENVADLEAALRREYPRADIATLDERADRAFHENVRSVTAYLDEYFRGAENLPDLALDAGGSAFQQRVWGALRAIPSGTTRTYAQLAAELGMPSATRAVARACATNRIALVVPCHRVIRSDDGLAGYRWGIERKRSLLERERGA